MGKSKSCCPEQRKTIFKLKEEGFNISEISSMLRISRKMIYNAIKHVNKYKSYENQPRKLRPKKTTAVEDRILVRHAKNNPFITAQELKNVMNESHQINISRDTITRRLRDAGIRSRVARKKPLISEINRLKRLKFAKDHIHKPLSFWKNVLWSDESKFNRMGSDGQTRVWRPNNFVFHPKYTTKSVKHGGGNIKVWGCMSWYGTGPIVEIKDTLTQYSYLDILKNIMEPYADDKLPVLWTFMHDNDPKHTARSVKVWLETAKIKLLEWPPQSPDLNPIENLWNDVDKIIKEKKIKNLIELYEYTQEAWSSISKERCQRLIESMPRRCAEVIKNRGFSTKY